MDRIKELFQRKKKDILSVYCTAGFPNIDDTTRIIKTLANAGADMIEVGIPFSDPVADGTTIQKSNSTALQNGMTLQLLFEQLANIRAEVSIPLVLMGYLNPILQYGLKDFCAKAQACGIDGLIVPDLPIREYVEEYAPILKRHGIKFIFLITPQTSLDRIRMIDELTDAFIYVVTSSATTGNQNNISPDSNESLKSIAALQLKNPLMAGFGIHDHYTFKSVCQYTNGAIIGSAFIRAVQHNSLSLKASVNNFIKSILYDHPVSI